MSDEGKNWREAQEILNKTDTNNINDEPTLYDLIQENEINNMDRIRYLLNNINMLSENEQILMAKEMSRLAELLNKSQP